MSGSTTTVESSTAAAGTPGQRASAPAEAGSVAAHVVAVAGVGFCVVSLALYAGLLYFVSQLPAEQQQLQLIGSRTPLLLRLVILGASAGLLNLVALVLCGIGWLLPGRSRWIALAGGAVALLLLLSIGSVVLLSALAG